MALVWILHCLGIKRGKKLLLGEEVATEIGELKSLLLFGYMGMGDAVMFEPTLSAYLSRFPETTIDVIVGASSQSLSILEMILKKHGRTFGSVYTIDFKSLSPSQRRKLNTEISCKNYDACLAAYTALVHRCPVRLFSGWSGGSSAAVCTMPGDGWYVRS